MISCHNSDNFKSPNDFKPERWLIDDSKANTRCTEAGANLVVPFGLGKRQCPGRRFVEMELMLIVAKVCLMFLINIERTRIHRIFEHNIVQHRNKFFLNADNSMLISIATNM